MYIRRSYSLTASPQAIILRLLLVGVVLALSVCGAPTTEPPTEPTSAEPTSAEPTSTEPTSTGNSIPITPTEERNCTTPTLCEFSSRYQHQLGMTPPSLQIRANVTLPGTEHPRGQFFSQMFNPPSSPQNQVCGTVYSNEIPEYVNSSCQWKYVCDYNAKRIPPYIFHAECTSPITEEYSCRTVTYPVPALYTTGCDIFTKKSSWVWRLEQIAVACIRVPWAINTPTCNKVSLATQNSLPPNCSIRW